MFALAISVFSCGLEGVSIHMYVCLYAGLYVMRVFFCLQYWSITAPAQPLRLLPCRVFHLVSMSRWNSLNFTSGTVGTLMLLSVELPKFIFSNSLKQILLHR